MKHTPNGYDPAWIQAINGALEDRGADAIEDIDDDLWDRFIGPMIDAIEDAAFDCPECARSFGPHYQGECQH